MVKALSGEAGASSHRSACGYSCTRKPKSSKLSRTPGLSGLPFHQFLEFPAFCLPDSLALRVALQSDDTSPDASNAVYHNRTSPSPPDASPSLSTCKTYASDQDRSHWPILRLAGQMASDYCVRPIAAIRSSSSPLRQVIIPQKDPGCTGDSDRTVTSSPCVVLFALSHNLSITLHPTLPTHQDETCESLLALLLPVYFCVHRTPSIRNKHVAAHFTACFA
ncbi:hypothetical protein EDD36DRAFT_65478 [Exophiala viscosa]|uniref:Uncharacterized protein n=1 Tax=Exophiala viscosa TaxID=2486360 RepID=A0AAN6I9L8_9EURO|nr:hypothetical protein EDD36DRAFT_65478 [Exophiala viscosa]